LGQRAAFAAEDMRIPIEKFPCVINGCLPQDISVTAAELVPDGFNPRHAARKTYAYKFYNSPCPNPLLRRYSAFVPQQLNLDAMKQAAAHFVGRNDFTAFKSTSPEEVKGARKIKTTVREIYSCGVSETDGLIEMKITGNGFLYNMVRIIAGTVYYAGIGKISPEEIPSIFISRDRARAGKTMPPEGLTLVEVVYE